MRLIPICVLVMLVNCCGAAEPASIPVVSTYAELLKEEPISLKQPPHNGLQRVGENAEIKLRFGVEADHIPAGCGAVVYLVTEGFRSSLAQPDNPEEQTIGPLKIEFCSVGTQVALDVHNRAKKSESPEYCWHGKLLFCQSIVGEKPGKYVLKIKNRHSNVVLAQTTIEVTGDAYHPWVSLDFPHELQQDRVAKAVTRVDLAFPGGEVAVPKIDGTQPWVIDGENDVSQKKKIPSEQPLPTITGTVPSLPEFKLDRSEREIIEALLEKLGSESFDERETASHALQDLGLKARQFLEVAKKQNTDPEIALRADRLLQDFKLVSFTATRKDDSFLIVTETKFDVNAVQEHLLMRCWINGEPFSGVDSAEKLLSGGSRTVVIDNRVQLNLGFDYKALGAHSGDRVAVQFLFCPHGQRSTQQLKFLTRAIQDLSEFAPGPQLPTLSNRIEWTAP